MSDPLPTDGPGPPIPGDEDYDYGDERQPHIVSQSGVVRICPTCLSEGVTTLMIQVSARSWICPKQRDEERRVSAWVLARVRGVADSRKAGIPF